MKHKMLKLRYKFLMFFFPQYSNFLWATKEFKSFQVFNIKNLGASSKPSEVFEIYFLNRCDKKYYRLSFNKKVLS